MNTRRTRRSKEYDFLDVARKHKRLASSRKKMAKKNVGLKKENEDLREQLRRMSEQLTMQQHHPTTRIRSRSPSKSRSPLHKTKRRKMSSPSSASVSPKRIKIDPKYNKYLRMKKVGVPVANIKRAMKDDNIASPTSFKIDTIRKEDIEAALAATSPSKAVASLSLFNNLGNVQLKQTAKHNKPSPVSRATVKHEFDALMRRVANFPEPSREIIVNFVGFENEARTNEKKKEHIEIVQKLIDNEKIGPHSGAMDVRKAVYGATKLIGNK